MEKKRSVGVIIFGLFLILYGIIVTSFVGRFFLENSFPNIIYHASYIITGVMCIVLIVGFFKLKNWARLTCIWGSILFLIWGWIANLTRWNPTHLNGLAEIGYFIYPNFFAIPTLIYLTRPKVKEQFK